jgi:hypothetical protein
MVFCTTDLPESVHETFMEMKYLVREELVHKKLMEKVLEDANQGNPAQEDSYAFPFFGNVGALLMATLNIPRLNVGISVWFWTTPNVPILFMLLR